MIPEGFPKYTLGWDILEWGSRMLAQPDGDHKGDPWVYSNEQALFILWFYAVNEKGEFIYRKAVLERPKGWGKSPLLAAICCTEFMGPVQFAGWVQKEDGDWKPVGKPTPTPLVQIAAISDSQAENTYALCRQMMGDGPIMNYYPDLKVELARSRYMDRTLEKVTASPRGREGNRATFVVMDETHLWVPAEKGPDLYEALARNLAKMDKRYVETTNAPVPGENSVAETEYIAYQRMLDEGDNVSQGLLFDTRQVNPVNLYDKEEAYPLLEYVYGDAVKAKGGWVNLDRIWEEINDPSVREAVARRFYFNQRVSPPSSWLDFHEWDACKNPRLKLRTNQKIALGFKSAIKNGAACLVGIRLEDGAVFKLGWWEQPAGSRVQTKVTSNGRSSTTNVTEWSVPWDEVDARVRTVLDNYNIIKMVVDPVNRRDVQARWYADYPDVVEEFWFGNKGKFARAVEQFETAVRGKRISWGSEDISRHVLNAHTEEVAGGLIIRKETPNSTRYISGAQASILALEAATLAIQDGGLQDGGTIWSF